MAKTVTITLVTTEGVTHDREGPASLHLFPDDPPEEKRVYIRG